MGIDAYQGILKKSKVSSDPRLNEQVTRVGQRIAAATARNDYQWEFKVLEDTQANAFCLPGGKVAVYTGILPITRDDAGLAAVLGHEVSHAIARHGGERMSQTLVVQTFSPRRRPRWPATIRSSCNRSPRCSAPVRRSDCCCREPRPGVRSRSSRAHLHGQGRLQPDRRARPVDPDGRGLARWLDAPAFLSTHPSAATRVTQIEAWMPEALVVLPPPLRASGSPRAPTRGGQPGRLPQGSSKPALR